MSQELNLNDLEAAAIAYPANITRTVCVLIDRVRELEAARIAYASEFPLNADGEPDVGNIHANIRKLKERAQPAGEAAKPVATVRVTNEGYAMTLSTYVAYALPEGKHDLYAAPPAAANQAGVPEEWRALRDAARDFYNATVAQPALRLSSTKKQIAEDAKAAGESLRSALLITESQARGGDGDA